MHKCLCVGGPLDGEVVERPGSSFVVDHEVTKHTYTLVSVTMIDVETTVGPCSGYLWVCGDPSRAHTLKKLTDNYLPPSMRDIWLRRLLMSTNSCVTPIVPNRVPISHHCPEPSGKVAAHEQFKQDIVDILTALEVLSALGTISDGPYKSVMYELVRCLGELEESLKGSEG